MYIIHFLALGQIDRSRYDRMLPRIAHFWNNLFVN